MRHASLSPQRVEVPSSTVQGQQATTRHAEATLTGKGALSRSEHTDDAPTAVISFDNTKAGLETVDKKKTEAIIEELSEGSNYYKNEERKLKDRQRKVQQVMAEKEQFGAWKLRNPSAYATLKREVDELERGMESERYTDRVFAHMDMDMFYAAVEEKKNPRLKELPIGVGSMSMLSTTNYVARKFGVRAGMAGFIGKKLCPDLVLVPPDLETYKREAAVVRSVAELYDPHFVGIGLDELTMELTPYLNAHFPAARSMKDKFDAAETVIAECRQKVFERTELTASAGIAPTTALAKMASNYNKPNGQYCLALDSSEAIRSYLFDKSVRSIAGIGKSTEFLLNGISIQTLGDIYQQRYVLAHLFPRKTFLFLFASCIGSVRHSFADYDALQGGEEDPSVASRKSVGEESTFMPLQSVEELKEVAYQHLHTSCMRLAKHELLAQHVVLKVKLRSFQVKYNGKSVDHATDDEAVFKRVLDALLDPLLPHFGELRLLGVRLEKIIPRTASVSSSLIGGVQRTISDMLRRCANPSANRKRGRSELQKRRMTAEKPREIDDDEDVILLDSSSSCSQDVEAVQELRRLSTDQGSLASQNSVEILSGNSPYVIALDGD